jgi:hypothetical protein
VHTDTVSTIAQGFGITYHSMARRENSPLSVPETAQVTSFLVGAFATPQVGSVSSNGPRTECAHTTMRDHCRRQMSGREAVWEEACCLVIGCGRVHQLIAVDPMRKWYKNHLHHESVSCCAWLTEHWWGDKQSCIDSFYVPLYMYLRRLRTWFALESFKLRH